MKKIRQFFKSFFNYVKRIREVSQESSFRPSYRVTNIEEIKEENQYTATIQVIGKNMYFKMAPEELLADDRLVNCFSPIDIRTLTYLGYLGVNNPKYKILAKRLSENSDKTIFALRKRGERKIVTKNAHEICQDKDVLANLSATDAHEVGYTVAHEAISEEEHQKALLKQQSLKIDSNNKIISE
jgi:hypothetical protein